MVTTVDSKTVQWIASGGVRVCVWVWLKLVMTAAAAAGADSSVWVWLDTEQWHQHQSPSPMVLLWSEQHGGRSSVSVQHHQLWESQQPVQLWSVIPSSRVHMQWGCTQCDVRWDIDNNDELYRVWCQMRQSVHTALTIMTSCTLCDVIWDRVSTLHWHWQ